MNDVFMEIFLNDILGYKQFILVGLELRLKGVLFTKDALLCIEKDENKRKVLDHLFVKRRRRNARLLFPGG